VETENIPTKKNFKYLQPVGKALLTHLQHTWLSSLSVPRSWGNCKCTPYCTTLMAPEGCYLD
jgi:hypothetical protein